MTLPLLIIDAFTDRPYAGNPAAVCLLDHPRDDTWMQRVAAEMNLSETAFLLPDGPAWRLRWFTPKLEVNLCGHATLASAHALWSTGRLAPDQPAHFLTRSGLLACTHADGWIDMDFPAQTATAAAIPAGLADALRLARPAVAMAHNGIDALVELADEAAVRAAAPDMPQLARIAARGVIVTAPADDERYDFVSRFFAPAAGIDEDPVTGSAHCFLAPYWSARLGRMRLTGFQASARGGVVRAELRAQRVILSGQAVTVLRGELAALA